MRGKLLDGPHGLRVAPQDAQGRAVGAVAPHVGRHSLGVGARLEVVAGVVPVVEEVQPVPPCGDVRPDVDAPGVAVVPVGDVAGVGGLPRELLVAHPGGPHGVLVVVGGGPEGAARPSRLLDAAVARAGDGVEVVGLLRHGDDVVVEHVPVLVRHAPPVHVVAREEARRRVLGHVEVAAVGVHGGRVRDGAGEGGVNARRGDRVRAGFLARVKAVEGPVELEAVLDCPVGALDVGDGLLLVRDRRVGARHRGGADGELGVSLVAHLDERHVRGLAAPDPLGVRPDVLDVGPESLGAGGVVLVEGVLAEARPQDGDGPGVGRVGGLHADARLVGGGVVAQVEHVRVRLAGEVHGDAVLAVGEPRLLPQVERGVAVGVGHAHLAPGHRELGGVLRLDVHHDFVDAPGDEVEPGGVEVVELVALVGAARLGARVAQLGRRDHARLEHVAVGLEIGPVALDSLELTEARAALRRVDAAEVALDGVARVLDRARGKKLGNEVEGKAVDEGAVEDVKEGADLLGRDDDRGPARLVEAHRDDRSGLGVAREGDALEGRARRLGRGAARHDPSCLPGSREGDLDGVVGAVRGERARDAQARPVREVDAVGALEACGAAQRERPARVDADAIGVVGAVVADGAALELERAPREHVHHAV